MIRSVYVRSVRTPYVSYHTIHIWTGQILFLYFLNIKKRSYQFMTPTFSVMLLNFNLLILCIIFPNPRSQSPLFIKLIRLYISELGKHYFEFSKHQKTFLSIYDINIFCNALKFQSINILWITFPNPRSQSTVLRT